MSNNIKISRFIILLLLAGISTVYIFYPEAAHAAKLYEVLKGNDTAAQTIKETWGALISFMNYAAIGVLIFIAFANILRININTYGIKKFLPTLVLALILANFSYFICRFFIDIANIIMDALINSPNGAGVSVGTKEFGIAKSFHFDASVYEEGTLTTLELLRFLMLTLGQYVGALIVLALALLFFIRNYIIYFLVALSPLAFMATVLPQTKSMFNTWWSNFLKWVFMPIVSLFWLWVGGKFIQSFSGSWTFLGFVFAIACYYLAITTPFKMGGGIMNQWKGWSEKIGKKAWGATGGAAWNATGAKAVNFAKEDLKGRRDRFRNVMTNKIYGTGIGKKFEGYQAKQRFLNQQPQDVRSKQMENADKDVYFRAIQDHYSKKKPMDDASFGRAKARMRKWTGEDQESVRGASAEALYGWLIKNGFTDPTKGNRLLTEDEILKVAGIDYDKYLSGKARIKEIREQTRKPVTREEAGPVWEKMIPDDYELEFTDKDGRKVVKKGEELRRIATANDIAGDVLDIKKASSLVGESIINPFNREQTAMLERAAMAGEGDVAEIAKRVGVDGSNPEQLEELRTHYGRISEALNGAVEDEMDTIREDIDGKLVGARHAFDLSRGGMRLDAVEKNASEGLSKIDAGDIDGARTIAKKLGLTDIEGDTNADELKKRFTDIRGGVGLVSQSGLQATGDWASFDKAVREKLSGGDEVMREQAKGFVEARMAFAKSMAPLASSGTTTAITSLDTHIEALIDAIIQNHNDLAASVSELKNAGNNSAIADIHKQLGNSVRDNLRSVFPSMMASDRATAAVDQKAFEMAMRRVYNDPAATKGLTRAIASANTTAMNQTKQKMIVDVKAPPGVTATATATRPRVTK